MGAVGGGGGTGGGPPPPPESPEAPAPRRPGRGGRPTRRGDPRYRRRASGEQVRAPGPRALEGLLVPPGGDGAVVARSEDVGDAEPPHVERPRVVGVVEQPLALAEAVLCGALLVAEDARAQAGHGVEDHHGGQLASREDVVADGHLLGARAGRSPVRRCPRNARRGARDRARTRSRAPSPGRGAGPGASGRSCGRPAGGARARPPRARTGSALSTMPGPPPKGRSSTTRCGPSPCSRRSTKSTRTSPRRVARPNTDCVSRGVNSSGKRVTTVACTGSDTLS